MNERLARFWLSRSQVGANKLNAMLEIYSAIEVYENFEKEVFRKLFASHYETMEAEKNEDKLLGIIENLKKDNINILVLGDKDYPESLAQSEVSPPLALYYRGDISIIQKPCIAIVGTRACSKYGYDIAHDFAAGLSECGVTIVSGLATGIDSAAHHGALDANGPTAAVLGCGIGYIYPSANANLYKKVEETGLILSEYIPDSVPTKYTFPERNRIISGISMGVVIVEAGEKSGSLITADFALEQGRDVYVVPGLITSNKWKGSHALIKNGLGKFVTSVRDICEDLHIFSKPGTNKGTLTLDFTEQKIYNLLEKEALSFDKLKEISGLPFSELSSLLTMMELKGIIEKLPANNYIIKNRS